MFEFPIRVNLRNRLPVHAVRVRSIREMVKNAKSKRLSIDPRGVQILAAASGAWLEDPQVESVLATIDARLGARSRRAPRGVGYLSQTDVLGAILGLAHFLAATGGEWMFASIPHSSKGSTPDIYAIRPGGRPWMIELKGTAPQESQIAAGERIETCVPLVGQVRKAAGQVLMRGVPALGGLTSVRMRTDALEDAECGGYAIAATVIPDGHLAARPDIAIEGQPGCPDNSRCTDRCLRARSSEYQVSLVGLLWMERNAGASDAPSAFTRCLGEMEALNIALWARSGRMADRALTTLAESSREIAPPLATEMLSRALTASRKLTTRAARAAAVDHVAPHLRESRTAAKRLATEAQRGVAERSPVISFRELAGMAREIRMPENFPEIEFEGDGYTGGGRVVDGALRMAPSSSLWRQALMEGGRGALLERASSAVSRSLLPGLADASQDDRLRWESRPVGLSLDATDVLIGREWPGWFGIPAELRHHPHFRYALARGRHGDWYEMWRFLERYYYRYAPRSWRRFYERWWAQYGGRMYPPPFFGAWASFDGRVSVGIPFVA